MSQNGRAQSFIKRCIRELPGNGRITFFQEFLSHPQQIGSIIPSSHFLEQRIVRSAGIGTAETIIELGPGTGGTTRAILKAMHQDARLLSIEINPHLHAMVSRIKDPRLDVHLGSALDLGKIISQYNLSAPDIVISGIPFSTIPPAAGTHIIEMISSTLAPGGRFVAYQVCKRVHSLCRPILGPAQLDVFLLNIPPMRVYRWVKNGASGITKR